MNDIAKAIEQILVRECAGAAGSTILPEQDLLANGIIDSLGIIKVVAALESDFSITVADEELIPDNFQTLALLTSFVERKLADA